MQNPYKNMIIINSLMRGGIVPEHVRRDLLENWSEVGYITCFDCIEGRSSLVNKPNIKDFLQDVAKFFGGDVAEHTFGCRGAQYAVLRSVSEFVANDDNYTNVIIVDPNSHYSTNIAAEMNRLRIAEPPHTGYPEYLYDAGVFAEKIEAVKKEHGKLPALVVVTHADPYYGNIAPIKEIGEVCEEYEVPYMINAAYTGGIVPINMKEVKADFLTLSAHKSMMSLAPLGYLVSTFKWNKNVFSTSKERPAWSGRVFGKKIPNIFGCSIGGIPLISSMLTFPMVKERVAHWDEELKKINDFVKDMEGIGDVMLLGQNPHRHHLLHFETPKFWEISKTHRSKGFFLAETMISKGIVGLHKGMSKHIKLSVYGLTPQEIVKVKETFYEIAQV